MHFQHFSEESVAHIGLNVILLLAASGLQLLKDGGGLTGGPWLLSVAKLMARTLLIPDPVVTPEPAGLSLLPSFL